LRDSVGERNGAVTWEGTEQTALGRILAPGDRAPEVDLLDPELQPLRLSSFADRILLLSTVPSLDTPVCDLETRRWGEEALVLAPALVVLTVSMDLPFALQRWRDSASVQQPLASAHFNETFGIAYGVLIKEKRLLSRAIFVIDVGSMIRFVEYVIEVDDHPNYGSALAVVRSLLAAHPPAN
jgi:thioredoxin-dependent peroxiredoxin